ncbi:hypothetical protein [Sphingobium nicotianae]|uniref:Uncharacterized protein n=1 Tax=Sphingobium nicotianae TaxID=2782607 RepID=A0A9X1DBK1_9SPHN|nr:hypothetical protein [Sphingobium nicotianae]MBT2186949.1 hypothetical protein [Sphingobium nicotianae]
MAVCLAIVAVLPGHSLAQEDHSGLTRASYRRNCLKCHHSAAPEGISPEIMEGLHPVPGLRPREALPGLVCWRHCETCKLPDRDWVRPNR